MAGQFASSRSSVVRHRLRRYIRSRVLHRTHVGDGLSGGPDAVIRVLEVVDDIRSLQSLDEFQGFSAALFHKFIERRVQARILEFFGFAGVKDGEPRIDPGGDGVVFEKARTEAVDSRDPGRFEIAQPERVVREKLRQLRFHVGGGLFGERDREDIMWFKAVLFDQGPVALDQNCRLAGARSRYDAGIEMAILNGVELMRSKFRHRAPFRFRREFRRGRRH